MLRNYFTTALRYLSRNRQYTMINIFGMAIAIACCILIIQFVRNEFSYDRFHGKSERIVRLWQEEHYNGEEFICTNTPVSAAGEIAAAYPEVESFCRVYAFNPIIKADNRSFSESVRMVDSTFFNVFDFELIRGNKHNPFPTPSSILITLETSEKLFGKQDPVGKTIQVALNNKELPFTVAGIVKKAPPHSSIRYNCLISYANARYMISKNSFTSWTSVSGESYLLLKKGLSSEALQAKLPGLVKQHFAAQYKEGAFIFHLQELSDIHLNNVLPAGNEPVSDPKYAYILATIGFLLLIVASVNFILLSLGRSVSRHREVGVRKVLGASPVQLIKQYWGESLVLTLCAGLIGIIISYMLFKPFQSLIGIEIQYRADLRFFLYAFSLILLIALLAGLYPALILSKLHPSATISNRHLSGSRGTLLQNLLITGQLVVSISLIVCTLTVRSQLDYIAQRDLGYQKNRLVVIETHKRTGEGFQLCERLKQEMKDQFRRTDFTASFYSFAQTPWFELGFTTKEKVYKGFQYNAVDPQFIPAMGLKIISGRTFSEGISDRDNAAIVNESFVRSFNLKDPVGKKLPGPFHHTIIGVVKDFNYMSLHSAVRPLVLSVNPDSILSVTENISFGGPPNPRLTVRLPEGSLSAGISKLETIWKKAAPGQRFDFKFVDESLMSQYENEKRVSAIAGIMAVLSIIIASLGLMGLATLNVTRRTKEIGIRKVLGASHSVIVWLLSGKIIKLVLISALITAPVTWYFLNGWLQNFAFHITLSWELFVSASLITLVIAAGTVSFQTIRAALANPVKTLRTE